VRLSIRTRACGAELFDVAAVRLLSVQARIVFAPLAEAGWSASWAVLCVDRSAHRGRFIAAEAQRGEHAFRASWYSDARLVVLERPDAAGGHELVARYCPIAQRQTLTLRRIRARRELTAWYRELGLLGEPGEESGVPIG
jgi:hypothetical protein